MTRSGSDASFPIRQRKHFDGNNYGLAIGPVAVKPIADMKYQALSCSNQCQFIMSSNFLDACVCRDKSVNRDLAQASFALNKEIYGMSRMPVGGTVGGSANVEKQRMDDDVEPVFYHPKSRQLLHDLLVVGNNVKAVIDFTAGSGDLAMLCDELKLPYVGVCLTTKHMETLSDFLTDETLATYGREAHWRYDATAAKSLRDLGFGAVEPTPQDPKPKNTRKPRAKGKAKTKPATPKKVAKAKAKSSLAKEETVENENESGEGDDEDDDEPSNSESS